MPPVEVMKYSLDRIRKSLSTMRVTVSGASGYLADLAKTTKAMQPSPTSNAPRCLLGVHRAIVRLAEFRRR